MPDIEVSASIFCARDNSRGTASIANTVTFLAASAFISSGFCAGQMKSISVWPACIRATSASVGGFTLKTTSDEDHNSAAVLAIFAPTAS